LCYDAYPTHTCSVLERGLDGAAGRDADFESVQQRLVAEEAELLCVRGGMPVKITSSRGRGIRGE
jgi:hypothetical protein